MPTMDTTRRLKQELLIPLLVAFLVSGFLLLLVHLLLEQWQANQRQQVQAQLAEIRTQLESQLNQASNASIGFAIYLQSYQGQIDEQRLARMAEQILKRYPVINNLAFAPNNVIRWNFPVEANDQTLGLDLTQIPEQGRVIERLRESRSPLLTGPVELVQGGFAVIHRVPVFLDPAAGNAQYWGLVSTPIMLDQLLAKAGALDLIESGYLAIRGYDGQGARGRVFSGQASLFDQPLALTTSVHSPDGEWQLAFLPPGWSQAHDLNRALFYLLVVLLGAGVFLLVRKSLQSQMQVTASQAQAMRLGERLQLATQAAGLGCWEVDLRSGKMEWDQGMFELYQSNPDTFTGQVDAWYEYLYPGERARIQSQFERLSSVTSNFVDEFKIMREDGEPRLIKSQVRVLRDAQGRPQRLVGTNEDVTEKRQAEQQLEVSRQEEKRLNEIMAHHFQEPVRRLQIFADQLKHSEAYQQSPQTQQAINFIHDQSAYLRSLVQGIQRYLAISHSHVSRQALQLETLLRRQLSQNNQLNSFSEQLVEWVGLPWPQVYGCPRQIEELLVALIENAQRHARPEQELQLRFSGQAVQGRFYLSIEDNGQGMKENFYQQALELFVNLEPSESSSNRGLGLGLPLARRIVQQHQGRLCLATSVWGGLKVTLDLPLYTPREEVNK